MEILPVPTSRALTTLFSCLLSITLLSGCAGVTSSAPPSGQQGVTISGLVHGGQQPISGAFINLWEVGTTGYYSAATALITSNPQTASNGTFNITGLWTCDPGAVVYITAKGGNPGSGRGNSAIFLMAAIGPCSGLNAGTNISINEASTVAAAWSLAQYGKTGTTIGSTATTLGVQGITNAMATASRLVPLATGIVATSAYNGNMTIPTSKINALANIIAGCVNSTSATSTNCTTLFSSAMSPEGTKPTTTLDAAFNIVRNPVATATSTLFNIAGSSPPFLPTLSATPADWTLGLLWTPPAQNASLSPNILTVGVDATGTVWAPDYGQATMWQIQPGGTQTSEGGYATSVPIGSSQYSLAQISGITFDASGNAWAVGNGCCDGLWEFSPAGVPTNYVARANSHGGPDSSISYGITVDPKGNFWQPGQSNNLLYGFNSSGAALTGSPFALPATLSNVTGIMADASGNLWIPNSTSQLLVKVVPGSGSIMTTSLTDAAISANTNSYVAVDGTGNIWTNGLAEVTNANAAVNTTGYSGGGYTTTGAATGPAIDGDGFFWIVGCASSGQFCLAKFNSSGVAQTTSAGLGAIASPIVTEYPPVIDGSGNLWQPAATTGLYEFVGLAAPVVTPLSTATSTSTLGTRP